ncbi:MAG TPA: DUF6263 family protein [Gemmatimonadota bacterium]|nr:DUF6263 family protein [Gemmatimonadota bacterium]
MRRAVPALLAVVAACGGSDERESVRLRFAYVEGDTLTYVYQASGQARLPDTTAPQGYVERSYEREVTVHEVATEITPRGHYVLSLVYRLESDGLAPGEHLPDQISFQVEITPQGRVVSVSGVETMKPLFGDIDFQSYFEQSQPVFPERSLKVGDSWTQEVRVVSPRAEPVTTSSTYVLESLVEEAGVPVAIIAFEGDIYLPVSKTAPDSTTEGSTTIVVEERIRVNGRIHFAHEAGVMRRLDMSSDATFSRLSVDAGEPVRRDVVLRERSSMQLVEPGAE